MTYYYLMDRLIQKPIRVLHTPDDILPAVGDMIAYRGDANKVMCGSNLWYPLSQYKDGDFVDLLTWPSKEKFDSYQAKAMNYYTLFKKQFKSDFPLVKTISARASVDGTSIYFYFYHDDRINFAEFVKKFRPHVPVNFFIYQVGARDMVRLSPHAKEWLAECGCGPMGCCGTGPLPTVEMDNITLQSLEGRDVEKLKGRCGKLKCSIIYERSLYLEESKKYPAKGQEITIQWQCARCLNYNIMSGEVVARGFDTGEIIRVHVDEITSPSHNSSSFDK